MKTKTISSLLLFLLTGFLAGVSAADDEAEKDAREALAELAASKRAAVVRLVVGKPPNEIKAWSIGVFISPDGLALVDLQGLIKDEKPTVEVAGNKKLKLGKILGVFPEQELALLQFDHRPKTWVPLAPVEPKIGDTIALLPLDPDDQWGGKIRPVIGPVVAKRSSTTPNLRVIRFTKILSLGSGLLPVQRTALGPGCFAVDRKGRLVAFTNVTGAEGRQTMMLLAPVVAHGAKIAELAKGGKDLGHPLPRGHNPIDPAAIDPDFHPMNLAVRRQDWETAERLLAGLQRRHPKSHLLKKKSRFLKIRPGEEQPRDLLLAFPEPDLKAPVAHQVSDWSSRANVLSMRGEFDAAIEARRKAIDLSPKDYPGDRILLAHLYAHLDRDEDAERLYQEAYLSSSDSIEYLELFEKLLLERGKLADAQKLSDRVFQLEDIYQRPR